MSLDILAPVLLTVISAATPLLFAALGELVVEKSGVLNLGLEGMMIVGAVCAFAAAATTGSGLLGILAGAAAGLGLAFVFGVLTLTLAANQVATGLALTIFGLGLSSLRSEEHTSELQSLMRISYAVFCLKKKKKRT